MELIIIIITTLTIGSLVYVIHRLLLAIESLTKLIKADNLQEYTMDEGKPDIKMDIGQTEERFKDVSELSDEDMSNIKFDPSKIYGGFLGDKPKTEKFNG